MRIGIVTISYNQAPYLAGCLESLLPPHQLQAPAVVVVDPGSTDGSRAIIEQHGAHLHRVILEGDRGPAEGLNKGLDALRGLVDAIGFINSDDALVPGALAEVARIFTARPDLDVILGAGEIIDETGRVQRRVLPTRFSPRQHLDGNGVVFQQGTFYRLRALDGVRFNPANGTCWDSEFLIDALLAGATAEVVPVLLGRFRLYPGTISAEVRRGPGTWRDRKRADHRRIDERLIAAGHRRSAWPGRLLGRLRPWHRLRQAVGLRRPAGG